MKKCAIISTFANNEYRRRLINDQIKMFKSRGIDVILTSSHHIDKFDNVSNYITASNVSESRYLSPWLNAFFFNGQYIFTRYEDPSKLNYGNYFVKMYQTVFSYAKTLGYDFAYFIDQDVILNPDHFHTCFSESLDTSKLYFYNLQEPNCYQVIFFYGNLSVLNDCLIEDNLKQLDAYVKTTELYTVENSMYLLAQRRCWQLQVNNHRAEEIFYRNNLFSSRNVAEVYYFEEDNTYNFLMAKGDSCENTFSAELYIDDDLIFSDTMNTIGIWQTFKLDRDRKYTIKYYDAEISPDTLSKTISVYTDSNKVTVIPRMTRA
jgi:hypothetical protein